MKKAECWRCSWTVVLDKTLESPLDCKEIQPVHPKGDQSWVFIGRTDVEAETPILWPPYVKSWCWERLRAGGEEDNREWDGWMASLTWWTWVWVNFGSLWWTERPGVLRFMGSQRVGHDWTEWTEYMSYKQIAPSYFFNSLSYTAGLHWTSTWWHPRSYTFKWMLSLSRLPTWGGYPHMPMILSMLNIIFQYFSLLECVSESVTLLNTWSVAPIMMWSTVFSGYLKDY